ncbi:hypothetical protein [Endozoicomonas sp. 4G]|uniref:hypothetical protein n=1 Tax=Endozoicomonas sp. 4G TaxID=2872754 RepID=UPI0020790044|nr:hypothetical protein [Endozoicomonas sp. 4G]
MTTSKKISVSVNPLGKSMRGSQSINKIESKVRFQGKESDFLYYTLRGDSLREALFHLVLIEDPGDSSKLYLGYYEEDEDSVIDTAVFSATAAPTYLHDVLNKTDTTVSNANATGSPDLIPKRRKLKLFKPILSLEKEQDYSIEFVWKSKSEITSVAMSDTSTMTYATINPSPTRSLSPESSSIAASTRQIPPDASAAIPESVGTQIIVKDKEGITLATLNLDLEPSYFSFSDENGYLLEYRIDVGGIHQLTKTHNEAEHENEDKIGSSQEEYDTNGRIIVILVSVIVSVCVLTHITVSMAEYYEKNRMTRLNGNRSSHMMRVIIIN